MELRSFFCAGVSASLLRCCRIFAPLRLRPFSRVERSGVKDRKYFQEPLVVGTKTGGVMRCTVERASIFCQEVPPRSTKELCVLVTPKPQDRLREKMYQRYIQSAVRWTSSWAIHMRCDRHTTNVPVGIVIVKHKAKRTR